MTTYAVQDCDWPWISEEGTARIVEANSPEEAAKLALAEWDKIGPVNIMDGAHLKIAVVNGDWFTLIGFIGFDRERGDIKWDEFEAVQP